MADLSTKDLQKAIKDILKDADLSSLSTKKVRKMLEEKFKADFTSRKKEIDKLVMKLITENEEEQEKEEAKKESEKVPEKDEEPKEEEKADSDDANGISDLDSEEEKETTKKKKQEKTVPKSQPKSATKRKSAGKADDSEDPVMSSIRQMDDEDLAKRLQEEESGLRTRGARRAALNPPKPKKRKEQDPNKKRKPSHYSKPCLLSDDLAAIVGTNEMARPEVVKTLWSLVKERNLMDPSNKQFFICDDQLRKVFGIKRVRGFGMMKYLTKHITNAE